MKKLLITIGVVAFVLGILRIPKVRAIAYNQTVEIVNASGIVINGVASATTASYNSVVQVVGANGFVINSFGVAVKTYDNANMYSTIAGTAPVTGELATADWSTYTTSNSLNDSPVAEPPLIKLFDGTTTIPDISPMGICTANCSASTGPWTQPPSNMTQPVIQYQGDYPTAIFDGNTVVGDYATYSVLHTGYLHDTGVAQGTTGVLTTANLGVIQTVNSSGSGGTADVTLNIQPLYDGTQVGKCIVGGAGVTIPTASFATICATWFPALPFLAPPNAAVVYDMVQGNLDILTGTTPLPTEISCHLTATICNTISSGTCATSASASDKHGIGSSHITANYAVSTESFQNPFPAPWDVYMQTFTGNKSPAQTLTEGLIQCKEATTGGTATAKGVSGTGGIDSAPLDGTQATIRMEWQSTGSEG